MRPEGGVGAVSLSAGLAVHERVQLRMTSGLFALTPDTKVSARDLLVSSSVYVVSKPTVLLRVSPGVSLPLGSASSGLEYTLLTTGSVDPALGFDVVAGSSWLFMADGFVRMPLYAGFDDVQQGLYGRGGVRVAKRVGGGGVFLGPGFAGQRPRSAEALGFQEWAVVAGVTQPLGPKWAGSVSARVPFYTGGGLPPYYAALALQLTRVVEKRGKNSE